MSYFEQKVVVITGGSAGLGLALAQAFVQAKATVVLVARDTTRLAAAADELGKHGSATVSTVVADVTRDDDASRVIAETLALHGRIDVLVNNVGKSARGTLLDTPLEDYRQLWELNFLTAVRMTKLAAPELLKSRGHVVNIGSLAAKSASRYLGAYATSKFPLAAFSQQLRLELADTGVHVLLVCPGPITRDDAGERYRAQAENLPESAKRPGGGVKIKTLAPAAIAARVLQACERREAEVVMPGKAKWLFAISQLSASWGDWLLRRNT